MDFVDSFKKNIGNSDIFQFFEDQDRFLYHYTSANTALEYILKNKQLMLDRYINTNDPKETKTWQFAISTNEKRDLSGYCLNELSERFTRVLKHRTNLVCFSQDSTLTGDHTIDMYARGFGKSRMWAQYADNHKGVCLIFKKEELCKAVKNQFAGDKFLVYSEPVIYEDRLIWEVNEPPHGFVIDVDYLEKFGFYKYVKAHFKRYYKALFFEKVKDWSSENEFRVVIFGEKEETFYLNIDGAMAGVVFGTDCTEEDIKLAVAACDGEKTQFQQIVWKNCAPWYSERLVWIP